MESIWLDKTRELRDAAWEALMSSSDFLAFKALDDTVVRLGGAPRDTSEDRTIGSMLKGVVNAAAQRASEGRKPSQADAAELGLRQANEPLPIGRFYQAAVEKGAGIGGADPIANFRSTVSRDERFVPLRRGNMHFWWLAGEPLPPTWNEPADSDLLNQPAGSSVSSNQEGGEGYAPATT